VTKVRPVNDKRVLLTSGDFDTARASAAAGQRLRFRGDEQRGFQTEMHQASKAL
jgi:hypothetical protein